MYSRFKVQGLALFVALFCLTSSSFAGPKKYALCRFERCKESLPEADLKKLEKGEPVLVAEKDPNSPFEILYVFQLMPTQVDPVSAAAVFLDYQKHSEIPGIKKSIPVQTGNVFYTNYELDVSAALSGAVALLAGAVDNRSFYSVDGTPIVGSQGPGNAAGVEWFINRDRTENWNKQNRGPEKTKPEYGHGYVLFAKIPELNRTLMVYANYSVVDNFAARASAKMLINPNTRKALIVTAVGFKNLIQRVLLNEFGQPKVPNSEGFSDRCALVIGHSKKISTF